MLDVTVHTVLSLLVYTCVVSCHLVSRFINQNIYEILLSSKGLKDIVVNQLCHSRNEMSLEFMLTVPLSDFIVKKSVFDQGS